MSRRPRRTQLALFQAGDDLPLFAGALAAEGEPEPAEEPESEPQLVEEPELF